jgi:hypothetical protein
MTRVIDIETILPVINTSEYSTAFDIVIDNTTVVSTSEFLLELEYNYHDMSYISHQPESYDVTAFIALWSIYKLRHSDEWEKIYKAFQYTQSQDYDPTLNYKETRETTPDITTESSTEYGHTITSSNSGSDSTTYGKVTTDQTNTYDGALRDSGKSTDSGSDSRTLSNSGSDTHSGTDTNTTTTTGTTTETKSGYKDNPLINLQTDIDFSFKNNLRDLIINNFAREFLIYDNQYRGGLHNGFYY